MRENRKIFLRYSITTAVAGLVVLLVLSLHGYGEATLPVEKYKILADAFTIPGMLMILFAALLWVSSEGAFDGLGYAFRQFGSMIIPFFGRKYKHKTYYEYKTEKKDKRARGYSFLFFVGLAFMVVAVVFIILHDSVYVPMV